MGVDVIDYTILAKKGLIKYSPNADKDVDVIDFTSPASNNSQSSALQTNTPDVPDFLSAFAQASANASPLLEQKQNNQSGDLSLKMDTIVNKIDDLMYKIETLSSRILQIEN